MAVSICTVWHSMLSRPLFLSSIYVILHLNLFLLFIFIAGGDLNQTNVHGTTPLMDLVMYADGDLAMDILNSIWRMKPDVSLLLLFLISRMGQHWVPWYSGHKWHFVPAPDDKWEKWSIWWMEKWQVKPKKNMPQCHLVHHRFHMNWLVTEPRPLQSSCGMTIQDSIL